MSWSARTSFPSSRGRRGVLADGSLTLPVTATYDLADVTTALANLAAKHTQGKLAVRVA